MKKRLVSVVSIALCVSLSFFACSNDNRNDASSAQEKSASTEGTSDTIPYEYEKIINNIINAYPWNDDDITMVAENPELSYMYRSNSTLSEIGFALIDLDNNGQNELVISDINRSFVYDLYTLSNGKIHHIFGSGERYFYYLRENGYIENQWSGSAVTSGHDFYKYNGGNLDFVERITMDAYHALDVGRIKELSDATKDNTFFISKNDKEEDYKAVSFDDAVKAIEIYQNTNKPLEIEYIALSEYIIPTNSKF